MSAFASRLVNVMLGRSASDAVELSAPGRTAVVVPAAGGELSSFRVEWQGQSTETIYRALNYTDRDLPPSRWTGRAPLLWPQPGRCRMPGEKVSVTAAGEIGSWLLDGLRLDMPVHGFVRGLAWSLEAHGADAHSAWATVALTDNEITRSYFPFAFRLECTYRLDAHSLRLRYRVTNRESRRPFWFGIGNHISFCLPFTTAGAYEDCFIYSPTRMQMEVGPDAFLTGSVIDRDLSRGRRLADAALRDTMYGGYRGGQAVVELWDPASFGMRVAQRVAGGPAVPDSALRFVFWAEPESRYFCPEPWIGEPDTLNTRRAAVMLAAGEAFLWEVFFDPVLSRTDLSFRP